MSVRHVLSGEAGDPVPPGILLEGVYKTYPGASPVEALKPCWLRIERGDYVAVMGPSGSGKTTLLNILGLLDSPNGGSFFLRGRDVGELGEGERNRVRGRSVGFVFQFFYLLPQYTALENVELGLLYGSALSKGARRAAAEQELTRVGLGHRLHAESSTLSGGERQRTAIARALIRRPDVLLCDEPTGNLDSGTSSAILDLIGLLHREGLTVIVVTHNPDVARRASRLVTIQDGVVSEASAGRARHPDGDE